MRPTFVPFFFFAVVKSVNSLQSSKRLAFVSFCQSNHNCGGVLLLHRSAEQRTTQLYLSDNNNNDDDEQILPINNDRRNSKYIG
mmetsp:Transcript_14336/g.23363  ORF Transcript_14336/g.23363 Transcript_14336/m.23363 type:complete len:84 (+) Transcript_14336:194-445(+)